MTTYICHETFDGIRTGRRWTLHSLDDLADTWEGDGTAYEETTARRLLSEWAGEREAIEQVNILAKKYGWDTTLYRADYLSGTRSYQISDRYSPNDIDRESALIAAWQHGDPDELGWEVEKKTN